jgi:hypothetical protein
VEPTIDTRTGLGDLLERVLDRGVFVKLDLIISVAGIPLVGLSLHAALASIETMNAYGMFGDWDTSTRAEASLDQGSAKIRLEVGETVVLEEFAMVRSDEGIMRTWRPGRAYLTDRRLMLVRRSPYEVLVSLEFGDIAGIGSYSLTENGVTNEVICLADVDGDMTLVRMSEPGLFQASLADLLRRHDIQVTDIDDATLRAAFPDVTTWATASAGVQDGEPSRKTHSISGPTLSAAASSTFPGPTYSPSASSVGVSASRWVNATCCACFTGTTRTSSPSPARTSNNGPRRSGRRSPAAEG